MSSLVLVSNLIRGRIEDKLTSAVFIVTFFKKRGKGKQLIWTTQYVIVETLTAAHNTKKYAIFVYVKSAYYSHKPNSRGLNNRPQIYKIVTKEHVYRTRICGGLDIFL